MEAIQKYTSEQLAEKDLDEMIELAWQQEEQLANIRGYHSGLTKVHLRSLGKNTLIRCFLENQNYLT